MTWSEGLTWRVEWDERARRELRKLDHGTQQRLLAFTRQRLAVSEDPKRLGHALTGPFIGLWRYRVGDFRLLCTFEEGRLVVLVVGVGHRREIYRPK